MELIIIYILAVYFSIGAVAIWFINRRKDARTAREGWMKYFVYLAIVVTTLTCLENKTAGKILFGTIILISGIEILIVCIRSETGNYLLKVIGVLVFSILAFGFWQFGSWNGAPIASMIYLIVFTFDGFAQISGQLFGSKKLAPSVSPQKTMAGLIGGIVMGTVTGLILSGDLNFLPALIIPLFICLAAFSGDLAASYFKRICGVKDYSRLIPGHGGMLDRFDSFIAAGALFFFAMTIYSIYFS